MYHIYKMLMFRVMLTVITSCSTNRPGELGWPPPHVTKIRTN